MYAQVEKAKENSFPTSKQERRALVNSVAQNKSNVKQEIVKRSRSNNSVYFSPVIQYMLGLRIGDKAFVHTNLGPIQGVIVGLLDNGQSYRIKLTDYYNKEYEVSHFIVDIDKHKLPSDTSQAQKLEVGIEYEESVKTKILAELDALIQQKAKKIEILEELRNGKTGVTEEEEKILAEDEKAISGRSTAMMMEADSRKIGGGYKPFIVMGDVGFKRFLDDLVGAVSSHAKGISSLKILHLILFNGGHYTPVKIEIASDNNLHIYSVDASGTAANFSKFDAFAKTRFDLKQQVHFYSDGDVQKDTYHCESFSMDDLKTMERMSTQELINGIPEMHLPEIDEKIDDGSGDKYFQDTDQIDSRFMISAQSSKVFEKHKKGRSSDPHLKDTIKHQDLYSMPFLSGSNKKRNCSIDYSRYQYLIQARDLVRALSLQEIENVLDVRIYGYRDLRDELLKDENLGN